MKHLPLLAALTMAAGQLGALSIPASPPRLYTHTDNERLRKADEKRQRKAAKRAASKGDPKP